MPTPRKTREAKPGELRGINILESIERMSRRPEARMDLQRALEGLSPDGQVYVRHLITSGPGANSTAAKACEFTKERLESAAQEVEKVILALRRS